MKPPSRNAADFPGEDRLAELERACADLAQPFAVADAFDVHDDDFDFVAFEKIGDHVERGDVRLVAGRDDVIEAHAFVLGERDDAIGEATALRDEGDRAAF
jgi:hypothetical protein